METVNKRKILVHKKYDRGYLTEEYGTWRATRHGRYKYFNLHETISYSDTQIVNGAVVCPSKATLTGKSVVGELGFNSRGNRYGQCTDYSVVNKQGASQAARSTIENKVEKNMSGAYSDHKVALLEKKDVLLLDDACEILHLARPTVYAMCRKGLIPHSKPGKLLYFNKEDLLKYSKKGGNKTKEEIDSIADQLLAAKKKTRK